jgi:hypothetical protein
MAYSRVLGRALCDHYRAAVQRLRWAAFVLFVLVSACGSSGGSSPKAASAPPLSKAAFIAQADAICKRGNNALNSVAPPGTSPAQEKDFMQTRLMPAFRQELTQLRALRPPPTADQAAINKMLDDLQQGLDEFQQNAKADITTAFAKTPQGLKDATAEAKAYGLQTCGQ